MSPENDTSFIKESINVAVVAASLSERRILSLIKNSINGVFSLSKTESEKKNNDGKKQQQKESKVITNEKKNIEEGSKKYEEKMRGVISQSMELDVAFEALEMMRKANLQMEFGDKVDANICVYCKREELKSVEARLTTTTTNRKKFSTRLLGVGGGIPCLSCGKQVCFKHRSKDFGKENIIICLECSFLFSPSAVVDFIKQQSQLKTIKDKVYYLLEIYDRTLLILKYSMQFVDDIILALQNNTKRNNKIGLGSSATGVISGVMGVTAAVTIFTPVGPPLLLASIVFGGSATAAAAGSEAVNYRCEPNKTADKIIALHAIITSIAGLNTKSFNSVTDVDTVLTTTTALSKDDDKEQNGRERATINSKLHITRAAMNGLKPLTAGALSAISIVTEAREMKITIDKIHAGNPCDKAETLRTIKEEVQNLPETSVIGTQLMMLTNQCIS